MIAYVLSIGGLPSIRRQASREAAAKAFRLPLGFLIPVIALTLCIWIAASAPPSAWYLLLGQAAVGMLLYALVRFRLVS